jgi:hypothetical protein
MGLEALYSGMGPTCYKISINSINPQVVPNVDWIKDRTTLLLVPHLGANLDWRIPEIPNLSVSEG